MPTRTLSAILLLILSSFAAHVSGQEPSKTNVQDLAAKVRPALVIFQSSDREGELKGVGTGFVVAADGLLVTNLHVIGEGRKFSVELADGRKLKVIEVLAADRHLDLAVVRVDTEGQPLPALELGEVGQLQPGADIVVMGNPYGLTNSVVSGVLSARRDIDGRQMLQLAIPIEPGNSGSPVVDMSGRVHGIVAMKSAVSNNLGFAIDIADLKPLLEKPNPIPIDRWLLIGALDENQWRVRFGANWRQRAGRIAVEGAGEGFGGRSLCLYQADPPEAPFDVSVRVRLDEEAGAAGLVFHSDGDDRHYGFYPSNGKLRLTCFQGPTVFTWQVLHEKSSQHYRPADWNLLRVHVDPDRFVCYVNGQEIFSSTDRTLTSGKVGLAKFRETKAQFRDFQVGRDLAPAAENADQLQRVRQVISSLPNRNEASAETLASLAETPTLSQRILRDQAKELEQQAAALRRVAEDVHLNAVIAELQNLAGAGDFELLRACLLVARLDDEDLDVAAYVREVDRMAEEIRKAAGEAATENERLQALDKYLFTDNGFHGSRHEYYHRANSYLNRVIDDREGLPITLSVLYIELGKRLGLAIEGVGLPGHFIVRFRPATGEPEFIDVFEGGQRLTREGVAKILQDHALEELQDDHLQTASSREILERVIRNLLGVAEQNQDPQAVRRYLEALVAIDPESIQYRGMRAIARFQSGRPTAAIADLDWFLEHEPAGVDLERIREMRAAFLSDDDGAAGAEEPE